MLRRQVRAREMLRAWANVIEDGQVEVLAQEDTKTRERTDGRDSQDSMTQQDVWWLWHVQAG
jgi:hypothetical protein